MFKNKYLISSIFTFFFLQFNYSQVGIGTTNPQATLHIEGNLRITNTNNISTTDRIIGTESKGDISAITVGDGLSLKDNILSANISSTTSPTIYKTTLISIPTTAPNQNFDNLDFNLEGANKDVSIFRLTAGHNYSISGFSGGIDGRHIIVYNSSTVNLTINSMNSTIASNNIDTLGSATSTSGIGTIEFVYYKNLNKWIVINIRN